LKKFLIDGLPTQKDIPKELYKKKKKKKKKIKKKKKKKKKKKRICAKE